MKANLKLLAVLLLLIFLISSLTLVALAESANPEERLLVHEEVSLAPGGIGLLATIGVTTTVDVVADDGQCTLREAITAANTDTASGVTAGECPAGDPGHDTIVVPSGTYTLTINGDDDTNVAGDLDIISPMTIQGAGSGSTVIDGNASDRIFDILNTGVVTISDVTITNGSVTGSGEEGGGIRNRGTLTLNDSIVSQNSASGAVGVLGGGIANVTSGVNATLTVNRSQIINNTVSGVGGGGISNSAGNGTTATVVLSNTIVSGNVATFTPVISTAGFGGGIRNGFFSGATTGVANVTLNNSTISNNSAINGGGLGSGTINAPGSIMVILDKSTVSSNTTTTGSGLTVGNGGGLVNLNGTMSLINSTVSSNAANGTGLTSGVGGGFGNVGVDVVTTLWLSNTTISGNTAASAGSALANLRLGVGTETKFKNTIISGSCTNPALLPFPSPIAGTLTSLGYNLESGNTCGMTPPSDLINTSPGLGALQNNGGDTETHALSAGSSAIDAGICDALTDDQRGVVRPYTGKNAPFCDIGAYESDLLGRVDLEIDKSVSPDQAGPGDTITYTLTFRNNGPAWAGGVVITDGLPVTLTNVISTSSGVAVTPTSSGWTVDDDLSRVSAGGTITITGQISSSMTEGTLVNTAEITTTNNNPDDNPDNDSGRASVTIGASGGVFLPIIVKNS